MKGWVCLLVLTLFPGLFVETLFAFERETRGGDWPQWRGQSHDGKALARNVFHFKPGQGLRIVWKKTLGSGYSSVSVADQRAVTMFSDGTQDYVIALDARTGEELWRYKIDATYKGHDNSHDGPIATPVIDGDLVFSLGRKGQILALDAKSGRLVWSRHLKQDFSSTRPHHGFGTSPFVYQDVLLLQTGDRDGKSVTGFNKKTGEILWTVEKDKISYQSPILVGLAGEEQVVGIGNQNVFGIRPQSGQVLWKYAHDLGSTSSPGWIDGDSLLLTSTGGVSVLIQVSRENDEYAVKELWRTRGIKQTYSLSIPHGNYIYGYSNRFLTCIDSRTGKTVWKSRPPGVGFLMLVDEHLVILTREGTLHVSEASGEGYVEKASLRVFEPFTWTPPSFAQGRIYARSLKEIACIEFAAVDREIGAPQEEKAGMVKSVFGRFIEKVQEASDKDRLIEEFLSAQKRFPIIEDDTQVHVVYRGEVSDLAIRGDMLDSRSEAAMNRVEGTDFYHYSFTLAPDARISYQLVKDLGESLADPLNPRTVPSSRGDQSEILMPKWVHPRHLDEPVGVQRGEMETVQFESKILESSRTIQVYVPSGYSKEERRYPVVYVNFGRRAIEWGKMPNSLDNLIGNEIEPVIAVFVHEDSKSSSREYRGSLKRKYARMLVEELIPYINQKYRTVVRPGARAIMGASDGGYISFYTAFTHPATFGLVAGQSTFLRFEPGGELKDLVRTGPKLAVRFYLDWGTYDERVSDIGHTNRIRSNRAFAKLLKDRGYVLTTVEANDGFGWASWRNRTNRILETFFPLE